MTESPAGMVDRVVLILEVFERSGGRLTLGQVSVRSGLPRSSAHRILQKLVDARLLHRIGTEYTLGLRMFEIGSLVVGRSRLLDVSRPLLQELAACTGLVAHLALLEGRDVLYLEKIGGAVAAASPTRVGGRLPAHCTGVGKLLLAHAPMAVVDMYVEGGLAPRTRASITSASSLDRALRRVREIGYAVERDEAAPGISCVAAPVVQAGSAVAAISVCGPSSRLVVDEVRRHAVWTAAEISRRLVADTRAVRAVRHPRPGEWEAAGYARREPATISA